MFTHVAHNTGTPHVAHDGLGFWLLVASIAIVVLIALWVSARAIKKSDSDM